jgi:hypothetical protein
MGYTPGTSPLFFWQLSVSLELRVAMNGEETSRRLRRYFETLNFGFPFGRHTVVGCGQHASLLNKAE